MWSINYENATTLRSHKRRADLLDTNLDLLTDIGADKDDNAITMSEIHANRHSVEALNRVFDAYTNTITN